MPPTIDHPADVSYRVGTTGHTITWHPYSSYPSSYEIRKDGNVIQSGQWIGAAIPFNVDGLQVGTYVFTCIVYDKCDQTIYDSVTVTVIPPPPTITCSPSPVYYNYPTNTYNVIWTISGAGPGTYTITGSKSGQGSWSSGTGIPFNVGGLGSPSTNGKIVTKIYYITLTATDKYGQSSSYTLTVNVRCGPQ